MSRFVLVHGAFCGAWIWEPLTKELEAAGHSVRAIDLPGSGQDTTPVADVTLDAYAERICTALAEDDEPAVLVGHSMGGMAITHAAARCPERVALLVYVAAFLPHAGQSLIDLTKLPEGADDEIQANLVVTGEPPVATMPLEAGKAAAFGTCTQEQQAWAAGQLGEQPLAPFLGPAEVPGDAVPRAYVIATQDRAIPPALQRRMVAENPCMDVVELDTDHSPMVGATSDLAAVLDRFASALDATASGTA
jgi:pimeloyl-ACP methyl ester carboxylesterase